MMITVSGFNCVPPKDVNMRESMENSAVATGLEKVSFHSNPKDGKCQRMFKLLHSCMRFIC